MSADARPEYEPSDVERLIADGSTANADARRMPDQPGRGGQPQLSGETDIARAKAWERFASALLPDSNSAVVGNAEELVGALRLLAQSADELAQALASAKGGS